MSYERLHPPQEKRRQEIVNQFSGCGSCDAQLGGCRIVRLTHFQWLANACLPRRHGTESARICPIKQCPQLFVFILNGYQTVSAAWIPCCLQGTFSVISQIRRLTCAGQPYSAKRIYFVHCLGKCRLAFFQLMALICNNTIPCYKVELVLVISVRLVCCYHNFEVPGLDTFVDCLLLISMVSIQVPPTAQKLVCRFE